MGKLLGLAVYNGVLLDLHLPAVLYKKLLGLPVGFDDLMSLDPSLHAGLKQLLEYEPVEEVEEIFCRTFEYEWEDLGFVRKVQLIPNGSGCPVTHINRTEYVHLLSKWLLVDSVESQFKHLLAGFHRVVHASALSLLRADELELLMAGLPHLNFHELQVYNTVVFRPFLFLISFSLLRPAPAISAAMRASDGGLNTPQCRPSGRWCILWNWNKSSAFFSSQPARLRRPLAACDKYLFRSSGCAQIRTFCPLRTPVSICSCYPSTPIRTSCEIVFSWLLMNVKGSVLNENEH